MGKTAHYALVNFEENDPSFEGSAKMASYFTQKNL
jgi:hypothetical protein